MVDRILVLSPHTDDGEFSAGGSINKWLREGCEVYWAVFSKCVKSLPKGSDENRLVHEWHSAMEVLGIPKDNLRFFDLPVRDFPQHRQRILEELVALRKELSPDRVLVPSTLDVHQDHSTITQEAIRAFKGSASIWGYEQPWNQISSKLEHLEILHEEDIKIKWSAISKYTSQTELARPYCKEEFVRGLAHVRGAGCNETFAEAFEIIRSIGR